MHWKIDNTNKLSKCNIKFLGSQKSILKIFTARPKQFIWKSKQNKYLAQEWKNKAEIEQSSERLWQRRWEEHLQKERQWSLHQWRSPWKRCNLNKIIRCNTMARSTESFRLYTIKSSVNFEVTSHKILGFKQSKISFLFSQDFCQYTKWLNVNNFK